MGGLRASCNAVKQLSAFTNKCLDSRSITPGKVVDPIKLEVKLTFNDGPSEANAAADSVSCDASMCQSDTASKQVVMGLDTVINSLVHEWNIQPDLTTQHAVAICKVCVTQSGMCAVDVEVVIGGLWMYNVHRCT